MIDTILNPLIAALAAFLGSLSGLGGGMIIKPLMVVTSNYNAFTINLISAALILFMSVLSSVENVRKKELHISKSFGWLIFGSAIGGFIGAYGFEFLLKVMNNDDMVQGIQSFIKILITFIFGVILQRMTFKISLKENKKNFIIAGIFSGIVSSFLAIGGGLVNVFVFTKLLNIKLKDAINLSLLSIIFSQLVAIAILALSPQQFQASISVILIMCIGTFIGVKVGGNIKDRLSSQKLSTIYQIIVIIITVLNIIVVLIPFLK